MFVFLVHGLAFGQVKRFDVPVVFKDTVGGIMVFDSVSHNFGRQKFERGFTITKRFKYIGKNNDLVVRPWTGDPHVICEYPREPLKNGQIYSIKVCFTFTGYGMFRKNMGLEMADGTRISLHFKGFALKE